MYLSQLAVWNSRLMPSIPDVSCRSPPRNVVRIFSDLMGCSKWSAYFFGQIICMASCCMITHMLSGLLGPYFWLRCVTNVLITSRGLVMILSCESSTWRNARVSRRGTILSMCNRDGSSPSILSWTLVSSRTFAHHEAWGLTILALYCWRAGSLSFLGPPLRKMSRMHSYRWYFHESMASVAFGFFLSNEE